MVSELAFVAGLRHLRDAKNALQIHTFLKNGGSKRPVVPVKERSFVLFGGEKRLDALRLSQLFTSGRVTFDMLRCRPAPATLSCVPSPRSASEPWLIVKNEATFHSFCRLNAQLALHADIVLGSGNAVLRATEFLGTLLATTGAKELRLVRIVIEEAGRIPVSICGELARQLDAIPTLLGVRILSAARARCERGRSSGRVVAGAEAYRQMGQSRQVIIRRGDVLNAKADFSFGDDSDAKRVMGLAAEHAAVIRISGPIGPATASYISRAIKEAAAQNEVCLVIELDTPGGLLDSTKEIVQSLYSSPVPTIVYVTPAGATAASAGCFIVLAADVAAMAPGTSIGAAPSCRDWRRRR